VARPRFPVRRSQEFAWLITAPLVLLAFVVTLPVSLGTRQPIGSPLLGLVFMGLFVLAELSVLRVEVRRQTASLSLTEIPLLLSLFYLPPLTVLIVRLVAGALVQAIFRAGLTKTCFNVAAFAAGTAFANLFVYMYGPRHVELPGQVAGPLADASPKTWLVLATAVLLNALVTLGAVAGVILLLQGWSASQQIVRSVPPMLIVALINLTVGMIMLLALRQSAWAVLLLAGLALVLGAVYRGYAKFVRQHQSLTEMYDLTKSLGEAGSDGTLADVLLARVRSLLQAESATLWLPAQGRSPETLLCARVDYPGLLDVAGTPDVLRRAAMQRGETITVGPRLGGFDELSAEPPAHSVKDAIVAPLRSGAAVIGTLEVAGRLGDLAQFGPDDVRLLETVAAQAAVAVENTRLVDRLRFDAFHDALTGLPNRRRILAALDEAIKARAPGDVVAVAFFDVARLRDVNDSLGHAAGDKVLAEVARRLRAIAPPAALVGRLGGDKFALTVQSAGAEAAVELAERVRTALRDRMVLDSLTFDVDAAAGLAVCPDHGSDAETLLQRADVACHSAKAARSSLLLFHAGLESKSIRRLGLAADLRRAIEGGQLDVYFQPKVGLADRRLVGVECLSRWEHPVHGSVAPEDFIAVAEHTGQLGRLTEFVLREGLRRARDWERQGRPLSVAVNLSPRTLLDVGFPAKLRELLAWYEVAPELLTLEIPASGVVGDPDRSLPSLRRISEIGVRLCVDDFGTGASSLAHLRRLPVHEVKIDRTFVQGMATDSADLAIVRAIVDLSRNFALSVVAEGVESELTLSLLDELGCDVGQGFLFSRPLPYERLDAWISAQREAAQTGAAPEPSGDVRWLRAVP
jgi:diguanylate cyclase (GGDEF)-like protein